MGRKNHRRRPKPRISKVNRKKDTGRNLGWKRTIRTWWAKTVAAITLVASLITIHMWWKTPEPSVNVETRNTVIQENTVNIVILPPRCGP